MLRTCRWCSPADRNVRAAPRQRSNLTGDAIFGPPANVTAFPRSGSAAAPVNMITLWQPPASLVAVGVKTSETRSWPAPLSVVGTRVGIHAAVRAPKLEECPPNVSWRWVRNLPRGAVVAFATIVACHQVLDHRDGYARCVDQSGQPSRFLLDGFGDYSPGRWIWELADVETVDPPIPATGRQRFWTCDIAAAAAGCGT